MLCTNCNTTLRPVVAVDIDGTLAQYHQAFLSFSELYFNRKFAQYRGGCTLAEHMNISKDDYRRAKLAYRMGGNKRWMPAYPKAAQVCESFRQVGAELWITTTRPYLRMDNTDPDTREWLERQGITYDGLLYDEDKYGTLIDIVGKGRVVAVLEDDYECYERAEELGIQPLLIQRNHNRPDWMDDSHVAHAEFVTAQALVIDRITQWKDHYGDAS